MNKFRQLAIGTQVLLTFGTLSAILLIIGGLFFFSLRSIESRIRLQQSRALDKLARVDDMAQDVGQIQADLLMRVLATDPGDINKIDRAVHDIEQVNAKELAEYQGLVDPDEEKQLYDQVIQARKTYWEQTEPAMKFDRANQDAEAIKLISSKQGPAYDEYLKAINGLIAHVEGDAQVAAVEMARFISRVKVAGNALAAIAIIIAIGTGVAITGIGRRLKEDNRLLQVEVTERKQAEAISRESEEKFRQLAETITDVFWITSPDLQQIHYVSPAYEQVWGRSAQNSYINPREWAEAILPEERERVFATFLKLAQEPSVSTEFRITRPDGSVRWIFSRGFQVRDTGGKVIRLAGVASDITERKQAEQFLRESEEKFRQLAGNITDVFWMTSPDLKVIQYISPGYELIWGRSAESLYNNAHQWVEAILPEERERVFGIFGALTQNEPSVSVEYRIARPDGTIRWVHDRGFQVRDASGRLVRLTGIVTDITERKQLEAQLFQSQKMETVGKLAGGIAHEFNSILTAIIGRSELLLGDLPAGGPDFANAMAIRKAADLAASLTKQLLAYGRKQILRSETLNLNQVLAGMEGMLRHLMGSDVDVRIVTAVGLPVVKADAGQIEQVIMNVAINAREAMHHGGKLTLETSRTTLGEEYAHHYPEVKAGDYVMLALSDTGEGMSEEVKAHLFEPFFTTKRVGEGTGLGLATCHGIIKQSGGHINVYSELGRGTTFKIYLPLTELRTEVPTAKPSSPPLPRGTETILLVEDDTSLREMASLLLQRLGYAVLVAANGPEAMTLAQQRDAEHIDLLFTDIVMPQMDGKELSDRIIASHPNTKVLFTSAYTETAIVHQGVLDPGVSLLQKPFTPSALALKVRELLDA